MITIYLSGNMTPDPKFYKEWTELFDLYFDGSCYRTTVAKPKGDAKFIVNHDLARLNKSDMLIINLGVPDESCHLTGAVVEVYQAFLQKIPVYAFTKGKRSEQADSPWLQQFITKEFPNFDELLDYLMMDENLPE